MSKLYNLLDAIISRVNTTVRTTPQSFTASEQQQARSNLGIVGTGKDGEDGKDGLTPHIGENGNWWIGNTDMGVKAEPSFVDKTTGKTYLLYVDNGKLMMEEVS